MSSSPGRECSEVNEGRTQVPSFEQLPLSCSAQGASAAGQEELLTMQFTVLPALFRQDTKLLGLVPEFPWRSCPGAVPVLSVVPWCCSFQGQRLAPHCACWPISLIYFSCLPVVLTFLSK